MHILTPTRAYFAEDVHQRALLLERTVQDRFPIGFEVILGGGPEGDLVHSREIEYNLEEFSSADDFYLALHAPLERDDYTRRRTDLTTEEGMETFEKVLELAKRINARQVVNVHPENFHLGTELLERDISFDEKWALQQKVIAGIQQVKTATGYYGVVTVENMPYPLMGDIPEFDSVEAMVYDPTMSTAADILTFASQDGIGICLDTCHYGISKRIIDEIAQSEISDADLRARGVLGLPREQIRCQPPLAELPSLLEGSLSYVQFGDYRGIWVPGQSHFEEGIVPGEGDFGEELRDFLKAISDKDIPIATAANDEDPLVGIESRRTLEFLMRELVA